MVVHFENMFSCPLNHFLIDCRWQESSQSVQEMDRIWTTLKIFLSFLFSCARSWPQGLEHTRQALLPAVTTCNLPFKNNYVKALGEQVRETWNSMVLPEEFLQWSLLKWKDSLLLQKRIPGWAIRKQSWILLGRTFNTNLSRELLEREILRARWKHTQCGWGLLREVLDVASYTYDFDGFQATYYRVAKKHIFSFLPHLWTSP